MTTAGGATLALDVVICTYNNAASLDLALEHLAEQDVPSRYLWRVTVIDNNCTDDTAARVSRHQAEGRIPGLRRIPEAEQGLTHARLAGIRRTTAPWVAFIDDDCMLEPTWIANACRSAETLPECGAFGGHVLLDWEHPPPPALERFGSLFAEQDHGAEPREVLSLAGAGFVVNRDVLVRSGWVDGPVLQDRVGRQLISGGDIELGLRLRAAGSALWYDPACRLRHVVPSSRMGSDYVSRLAAGLGAAAIVSDVLVAAPTRTAWARAAFGLAAQHVQQAIRSVVGVALRRGDPLAARILLAWAGGALQGCWQLVRMDRTRRAEVVGVASGVPPLRWRLGR